MGNFFGNVGGADFRRSIVSYCAPKFDLSQNRVRLGDHVAAAITLTTGITALWLLMRTPRFSGRAKASANRG
ncbi:MAG TPA: hypothetical protein VMO75_05385 [Chthoniobacterales bacterium]|nr:hypothetical protein [Chthoniobacterales bacterium]